MKPTLILPAGVIVCVAALAGCSKSATPAERAAVTQSVTARTPQPVTFSPALEMSAQVSLGDPVGSIRYETQVAGHKYWVYKPQSARTGATRCVVMAPAGTRLFHGIGLAEGDMDEHKEYVRAGFAVVACELDGALSEEQLDDSKAVAAAAAQFAAAKAGVNNLRAAIDVAASVPFVDTSHIYVAGHSSAATLALETAAFDGRIAGCVAHAPEVNVTQFVKGVIGLVEAAGAPGLGATLDAVSPHNNVARMTKPLYLFVAEDDDIVSPVAIKNYAEQVRRANPAVTLAVVPKGGHFDAMIAEGIPGAAAWIQAQP